MEFMKYMGFNDDPCILISRCQKITRKYLVTKVGNAERHSFKN
jgi:hypothetical protein